MPSSPELSALGAGTRAYMAPEQFESLSRADTRNDIISFDALLYEVLTGRGLSRTATVWDRPLQSRP